MLEQKEIQGGGDHCEGQEKLSKKKWEIIPVKQAAFKLREEV